MKKICISSSSFILSKHPSWEKLSSSFDLNFDYVGNYSGGLLSKNKNEILACILFASDLYDENLNPYLNNEQIKKICDPVLDLIAKKANYSKQPIIISFSSKSNDNLIISSFKIPSSQRIFEYFSNKINFLQKKNNNIFFINIDNYFSEIGYSQTFDKRNWYLANCRITLKGLEIIVENLIKILNRIQYPSKKLLILDCDNTLWGGVIGEDGINSIRLGQDGEGKAFVDFQKTIKSIFDQGILLAICSKNNEKDVMEVFNKHESMQIKKKDIINFKINWEEKSLNIKKIAIELDLGLQSFVFWDDNPFERDKVKKNLPEVLTIDPSEDISYWPEQLKGIDDLAKFEVTKEDKKKLYQYKIRSKFVSDREKSSDEIKYLKSIKLNAKRISINSSNISRAAQMTQKTNQFNLRTIRYTQSQIQKINNNKKNIVFLASLKDIYGDHGIIGILIAKKLNNENLFIDTMLLSCRILGRNLETWMLRELMKIAAKIGIKNIYAEYIKTSRNSLCSKFYSTHNFKEIKKTKELKKFCKNSKSNKFYHTKIREIKVSSADVYD